MDQFLAQNKTPYVGWGQSARWTNTEWGSAWWAMAQVVKATGKKPSQVKMALIGPDVGGGITATAELAAVAKQSGIDVVLQSAPIPVTSVTNRAPYVQSIISSGANAVYEITGSQDSIGLSGALRAAGF